MTGHTDAIVALLQKREMTEAERIVVRDHIFQLQNENSNLREALAEKRLAMTGDIFQVLRDWGITSVDLK